MPEIIKSQGSVLGIYHHAMIGIKKEIAQIHYRQKPLHLFSVQEPAGMLVIDVGHLVFLDPQSTI